MSLKDFERTYYAIEKSGSQTLIYPHTRISYDSNLRSLVIQKPLDPTTPITIELWQMAEQYDINRYEWLLPRPITTQQAIDELILNSTSTPWSIDGIEEQDTEGSHYDGHPARTFNADEEITPDDIRLTAYEEIDKDAQERIEDYLLITKPDGEVIGMTLYPMDAEMLCGVLDKEMGEGATAEYMGIVGIRRLVDLSPLRYAVLTQYPSSNTYLLVAALDTFEHAQTIAECRRQGTSETGIDRKSVV